MPVLPLWVFMACSTVSFTFYAKYHDIQQMVYFPILGHSWALSAYGAFIFVLFYKEWLIMGFCQSLGIMTSLNNIYRNVNVLLTVHHIITLQKDQQDALFALSLLQLIACMCFKHSFVLY
jgi:hypothetical protein